MDAKCSISLNSFEDSLKRRDQEILSQTNPLGVTDMCIICKEESVRKFIGTRTTTQNYLHYVYGANTSSLSTIAAYFSNLIDSSANVKLTHGIFCVYDVFSRHDVRTIFKIPGKVVTMCINENDEKVISNEQYWNGAYVSSVLRYFYAKPISPVRIIEWPKTHAEFREFFQLAITFLPRLGFVIGDMREITRYKQNLLFPAISKFLIERKMLELHYELFSKLISQDPLVLCYIADSHLAMRRHSDALSTLADQLVRTPHAVPLLIKECKALIQSGRHLQALNISKILVQLSPEYFEC